MLAVGALSIFFLNENTDLKNIYMRTVILLGLLYVRDCINEKHTYNHQTISFLAIVLLVSVVFDTLEFVHNLTKK